MKVTSVFTDSRNSPFTLIISETHAGASLCGMDSPEDDDAKSSLELASPAPPKRSLFDDPVQAVDSGVAALS